MYYQLRRGRYLKQDLENPLKDHVCRPLFHMHSAHDFIALIKRTIRWPVIFVVGVAVMRES